MEWKDIATKVGQSAPILGSLLGGPAGAAVGALVASALGVPGNAVSVDAALVNNPEAAFRLAQIESDRTLKLAELAAAQAKIDIETSAADRASARGMNIATRSPMPAVLTSGVGLAFVLTVAALFMLPIPESNRDVIVYMCGQLAAAFAACLAFWVGTTRASENKTTLLAQR